LRFRNPGKIDLILNAATLKEFRAFVNYETAQPLPSTHFPRSPADFRVIVCDNERLALIDLQA
jgi:hypothetical protein